MYVLRHFSGTIVPHIGCYIVFPGIQNEQIFIHEAGFILWLATLDLEPVTDRCPGPQFSLPEFETALADFSVDKIFLLRHGFREYVLVRK